MSTETSISPDEIDNTYKRLKSEAEAGGYRLNKDTEFTKELIRGLLVNGKRYGYWACPCRLAAGNKEDDLDIICPCDYRDADLDDYGTCYCSLYVSQTILNSDKKVGSIPERRLSPKGRGKLKSKPRKDSVSSLPLPVWRCRVCGYLCARDGPPEACPICKAKKERFERFI